MLPGFEERPDDAQSRPDHGREIEAFSPQLDLAAPDSGDIEEVVDESDRVLQLTVGDLARPVAVVLGGPRRPEELEGVADRGERVPQLVRERREELVLATVGLLQRPLGLLALGHVEDEGDGLLFLLAEEEESDQDRDSRPVLAEVFFFVGPGRAGPGPRLGDRAEVDREPLRGRDEAPGDLAGLEVLSECSR